MYNFIQFYDNRLMAFFAGVWSQTSVLERLQFGSDCGGGVKPSSRVITVHP